MSIKLPALISRLRWALKRKITGRVTIVAIAVTVRVAAVIAAAAAIVRAVKRRASKPNLNQTRSPSRKRRAFCFAERGYASRMAVVMLARFASLPEAFVVRSALQAEGIGAFMPEQGLVAAQGATDVMGGWPIFVIDEELEAAHAVVRTLQRDAERSSAD